MAGKTTTFCEKVHLHIARRDKAATFAIPDTLTTFLYKTENELFPTIVTHFLQIVFI